MTLSANTLFHFTRDYGTLLSILKSKFYPRLCLEKNLWISKKDHKWAVPMVCFCDIPLSSISDHSEKYGKYAIGIKKSWAIEQGVTPILYVHEKSGFLAQSRKIMNAFAEKKDKGDKQSRDQFSQIMSMFFMMKPYEGTQSINGRNRKVRFYDEREWRYISPIDGPKFNFLTLSEYNDEIEREVLNEYNKQFGVTFNPDAINYLIVEKEDEIVPLMHELDYIKGEFPHNSVQLLKSRILSMDRISEDF